MGFPRQEYWSGLPFPSPENLPDPGFEPTCLISPALASGFFTTSATQEAPYIHISPASWISPTLLRSLFNAMPFTELTVCGFTMQPKGSKSGCSNLFRTQEFQGEGAAAWVQPAFHQATVSCLLLENKCPERRVATGVQGLKGHCQDWKVQEPLPSSRTCTDRQVEKEDKEVPPTPPGGLSC